MYWISIIVPVYNGEKTLAKALDSAISQPLFSCSEIVIINDGSLAGTGELCAKYCKMYSNIHVYKQENSGRKIAAFLLQGIEV